jgi:hypothetical protein
MVVKIKILCLFLLSGILLLSGCNKRDTLQKEVKSISFSLAPLIVSDCDDYSGTKTGIVDGDENFNFIWVANDTVGIYPDRGSQVYFEISAGAGSSQAEFDGGGWAFKASSVYYSYYPFVGDIYLDRHNIPVDYTRQNQPSKTSTDHVGVADFAYTEATSATSGSLNFQYYHLSCFVRFRLSNLPAGTYTKLIVRTTSPVLTKEGHFDLLVPNPVIESDVLTDELSMDLNDFEVSDGETVLVYMALAPVDLQGQSVTVSVLDSERKEYQCIKTPSKPYEASWLYGLGCTSWTEIPQSVGFSMTNWDSGVIISGIAQ